MAMEKSRQKAAQRPTEKGRKNSRHVGGVYVFVAALRSARSAIRRRA
jgi:hypothetical protein